MLRFLSFPTEHPEDRHFTHDTRTPKHTLTLQLTSPCVSITRTPSPTRHYDLVTIIARRTREQTSERASRYLGGLVATEPIPSQTRTSREPLAPNRRRGPETPRNWRERERARQRRRRRAGSLWAPGGRRYKVCMCRQVLSLFPWSLLLAHSPWVYCSA